MLTIKGMVRGSIGSTILRVTCNESGSSTILVAASAINRKDKIRS